MNTLNSALDPAVISFIQTTFLSHLRDGFNVVSKYALNLLYLFASLELALFGILWALKHHEAWERFFFKILKIGLIFFILQNYDELISVILKSFVQIGGLTAHAEKLSDILFNPAVYFQYGYDNALHLLKDAVLTSSFGLAILEIILGIGLLLAFGLLGIEIILAVIGFYLVALTALLFLPFSAFSPTANMFDGSVGSVLKAGVRVMILMMVVGVAILVFDQFHLSLNTEQYNLNQPLGLFFSALLFLILGWQLPKLATQVIGHISMRLDGGEENKSISMATPFASSSPAASMGNFSSGVSQGSSLESAARVDAQTGSFASPPGLGAATTLSSSPASALPTGTHSPLSSSLNNLTPAASSLADASMIQKSIREITLKKIKKDLKKILEKN